MPDIATTTRPPLVVPGSEATGREIVQQPDVWREADAAITSRRAEIDAFLEPLLELEDLRIILTGAGTSAFAGDIVAPSLTRRLGRRVDAVATTTIVSNPAEVFAEDVPTLLVSFARSGNSPESLAATALADECLAQVHHLVLTCDAEGALFTRHQGRAGSLALLMPERANDQGFAMTSSFTSMLLSCLIVFRSGVDGVVDALATSSDRTIDERQADIQDLAGRGLDRIVYLGSGALAGLAHESALKLLELTAGKVVTYFDTPLGFRHGPKAVLNDRTLVFVYLSSDPYTRLYDLDIVTELRRTIGAERVIVVSSAPIPEACGSAWILPGLTELDDAFLAVAYVVIAQLVGLSFSLQLGMTPDNPFPGNEVNRVVQGVTVHPLAAASTRQGASS